MFKSDQESESQPQNLTDAEWTAALVAKTNALLEGDLHDLVGDKTYRVVPALDNEHVVTLSVHFDNWFTKPNNRSAETNFAISLVDCRAGTPEEVDELVKLRLHSALIGLGGVSQAIPETTKPIKQAKKAKGKGKPPKK